MNLHYKIVFVYFDFVPCITLQVICEDAIGFERIATYEQECWSDLKLRPIVSDDSLQYLWVH